MPSGPANSTSAHRTPFTEAFAPLTDTPLMRQKAEVERISAALWGRWMSSVRVSSSSARTVWHSAAGRFSSSTTPAPSMPESTAALHWGSTV